MNTTTIAKRTSLRIRYADPETTPSRYPSAGWTRTDLVMDDDYWTLHGPDWALRGHVEAVLADNNLNDYGWVTR